MWTVKKLSLTALRGGEIGFLSPFNGEEFSYGGMPEGFVGVREARGDRIHLQRGERSFWVERKDCFEELESGFGDYQSPMPGQVIKVMVEEGCGVKKGDALLILEAMKMEHTVRAFADGVVKKIYFSQGEQVPTDALLLEMED